MKATIEESGNGFPNVGDLVYDSENNTVYKIKKIFGQIQTHGGGRGNTINVIIEEAEETDPTAYSPKAWEKISDGRLRIDD